MAILDGAMATAGHAEILAANPVLLVLDRFTLSAWVKVDGTNGDQTFVARAASPWADQAFFLGAYNGWLYSAVTTNGLSAQLFAGGTIKPGTWTHLALTYDGAELAMYVNGTLAGHKAASGHLRADTPSAPAVLGARIANSTAVSPLVNGVDGIVGPARIFDRALTPTEIAADFGRGR